MAGIFYFFVFVFETGFLCVTVLAVLELALIDQAGLEFTEIRCLCLPSAGIKDTGHHHLTHFLLLLKVLAAQGLGSRQKLLKYFISPHPAFTGFR